MNDYELIKQHKLTKKLLNYKRVIVIAIYIILIYKYIEVIKFSYKLSSLPFGEFEFTMKLYVLVVISAVVYLVDIINLMFLKGRAIKNLEIVVIFITLLTFNVTIKDNLMHVICLVIGILAIGVVMYRRKKVSKRMFVWKEKSRFEQIISIVSVLFILIIFPKIGSLGTMILVIGILLYILIRFANYNYNYDLYLVNSKYSEEDLDLALKLYEEKYGKLR